MIKKYKIPFGKPIINQKEIKLVNKVMKSSILVHGKMSLLFEKKFKQFTKAKDAISISSCTAGMHLIYFHLGIKTGDEVIVPAQTHVATAHAVELTGAKAVFVDCELDTGNIDIKQIKSKINKKTKAIAVVHYLGNPVNMIEVMKIAKKYNLFVIEDCALALGAKINSKHVGLFGDAGIFSFYPVKHMTTAEGGMIILKNKKMSKSLRLKKAFGVDRSYSQRKTPGLYNVETLGFNYRMSEIHAAIGIEQLKKLKRFLINRKSNFIFLERKLSKLPHIKVIRCNNKNLFSSYYCLMIMLNQKILSKKFSLMKRLKENNIGTSIYYPHPVPRLNYYKQKYKYKLHNYKNASIFSDNTICLPIGPHLEKKELNFIAKTLEKEIKEYV